MLLKTYLIVPIFFLLFNSIAIFPHFHLLANIQQIEITGQYNALERVFRGSAKYQADCYSSSTFEFHLPPNRNSNEDWRAQFQFRDLNDLLNTYNRSDLGELKKYHRKNPQLPKSIEIIETRIDEEQVNFDIVDNPSLSPLQNTVDSILVLRNEAFYLSCKDSTLIDISFITKFNSISEDWVDLLWDFIPRPVTKFHGKSDYSDHWSVLREYNYQIRLIGNDSQEETIFLEGSIHDILPIIVADKQITPEDEIKLALDGNLKENRKFLISRIEKVTRFLAQNKWLQKEDLDRNIALWSGPLTATSSHIFLPQRLFRYHSIYHKTFEVVLLRAFIHSSLLKRYSLNTVQYPWLEPAISSEIIRDYFFKEYSGDSRFFSWGQWLNPDFYQENTIKNWLAYPGNRKLISGTENKDLRFLSNAYHPWYEKGFHLFRSIVNSNQEIESQIYPALKRLLKRQENGLSYFDRTMLFDFFELTDEQKAKANTWLSLNGRVDYEIQDVDIGTNGNQTAVVVDIDSHGSLAPPLEINFILKNGLTVTKEIISGAGTYDFTLLSPPTEISLDPYHKLLESDLLNNHWYTPFKVRPIWDFPAANSWLVTVSPVINGNTFDKNLFGISFGVRYLDQTEFNLSGWRSDGDEQILWESNLVHSGFPWTGSEIYLERSELNASLSKTAGYKHTYADIHKDLWFSLEVLEETLDRLEEDVSSDNDTWQSAELRMSFPVYVGSFSDSVVELFGGYGRNTEEATNDFQRQGISTQSIWYLGDWKIHLEFSGDYSSGLLPLQKKYPIGGPEGLPGFPREEDLLFDQRTIAGFGVTLPPYFTHTNINALRLGWLEKVETTLFVHWAEVYSEEMDHSEIFKDVELRFNFTVEWLNMYEGDGVFAVAQPLDNEKYKDYRIILFSDWVF
ncbi:MAG: hypothetical protein MJE63_02815 [Proteobacteria bacterium]|nr:hypothetical protein [Pseudomonadota bacterium]